MFSGDRVERINSESKKLIKVIGALPRVELIDREKHRFVGFAQAIDRFAIKRIEPAFAVE